MDSSATIIMALALIFYSVGVWGEHISGRLKWWHLLFFVFGLICDSWGTGMMFEMVGGMTFDVHGITGLIAIVLMFIHALWALACSSFTPGRNACASAYSTSIPGIVSLVKKLRRYSSA